MLDNETVLVAAMLQPSGIFVSLNVQQAASFFDGLASKSNKKCFHRRLLRHQVVFFAENYEERFLIGLSDPSATLIVTVARNLEFQFERRLDSCFCNKQRFKFENVI